MALMRKSSDNQLKRLRKEIKKCGGDITDKISKDEQKFPNTYYTHNMGDVKVDTYEDNYSLGNNTQLGEGKNYKHVKTFEQFENKSIKESAKIYDFPFGVNQVPDFYIKQWLDLYSKWNEENHTTPEYENFNDVMGDEKAISVVFYGADQYAKERSRLLDGAEFMDSFFLKESKMLDLLRLGKGINMDDVKGIINRIEGKFVFVETQGGEIVKVPMSKILKHYSKADGGFKYVDALKESHVYDDMKLTQDEIRLLIDLYNIKCEGGPVADERNWNSITLNHAKTLMNRCIKNSNSTDKAKSMAKGIVDKLNKK